MLRGVAVAVGMLALSPAVARADAPAHPSPVGARGPIPLGSALWYACSDPAYSGPAALQCQVQPYDARYASTFEQYFDRFSPENELKMLWTQPSQGSYDFSVMDKVMQYARAHNKQIRGHTLIYPAANPNWVDHPLLPWTRDSLLNVMRNRISTVVGRYKADIHQWDVVNEPFSDSGARDDNIYQRTIGDDWIEQAFRAANAADPTALLFLNEFHAETVGPRQQAVLALVSDFVHRGVPIDGVGLEMHVGADGNYPTAAQIEQVMDQYAALGLRVEVTEADALRPSDPSLDPVITQRAAYDNIAAACQASLNCTGMTVWGVADPYSWRSEAQTADLFTKNFTKKLAYDLIRCRLNNPKPPTGAWDPTACGPVSTPPPDGSATPTGPTDGSSTDSNPNPGPGTSTPSDPSAGNQTPQNAPQPQTPAASSSAPSADQNPSTSATHPAGPSSPAHGTHHKAALFRATVRNQSVTLRSLSRGVVVRISGARPQSAVTVQARSGTRRLAITRSHVGATGTTSIRVRLSTRLRMRLTHSSSLTITCRGRAASNTTTTKQLHLRLLRG